MRTLLVCCALALIGLWTVGCGGSGSSSKRSSGVTYVDGYMAYDEDAPTDDEGKTDDDIGVKTYGRAATTAEQQAITVVVRHYYAAASAGNGAAACALIYPELVKGANLEQSLPEEYRPAPGSTVLRGKGCPQVESVLFEVNHQQFVAQSATLHVTAARVNGVRGLALLGFRSSGEHEIALKREGGAWKIDALLPMSLP